MSAAELPNDDPTGGTSVLGDGAPFDAGTTPTQNDAPAEAPAPAEAKPDGLAKVRDGVSGLRDQALDQARDYAATGKDALSKTIGGYAETVREAANDIEERTTPEIARYAHQAADFLEEAAETIRTRDVDELVDEAREFVRRSPALAIGAAAAIGFALSRFLKATSERLEPGFAPPRQRGDGRPAYDA